MEKFVVFDRKLILECLTNCNPVYIDILACNSESVFSSAFQCFYCNLSSVFVNMPTTYHSFFLHDLKAKSCFLYENVDTAYARLKIGLNVIYGCNYVCCARLHAVKELDMRH